MNHSREKVSERSELLKLGRGSLFILDMIIYGGFTCILLVSCIICVLLCPTGS